MDTFHISSMQIWEHAYTLKDAINNNEERTVEATTVKVELSFLRQNNYRYKLMERWTAITDIFRQQLTVLARVIESKTINLAQHNRLLPISQKNSSK